MGLSYSRLLFLAALFALVWLSLRPSPAAERALDVALAPARALTEVAGSFALLSRGESRAADRALLQLVDLEHAASRALYADERQFALPDDPALRAGRRFVHAQVIERADRNADRVVVALEGSAAAAIQPGMPVALGNSYVGRVASVDHARGSAQIDLVTAKDFRVGARIEPAAVAGPAAQGGPAAQREPPIAIVVGGLSRSPHARPDECALELHNPSRAERLAGRAVVDESRNARAPYPAEAAGFHLGVIAKNEHGEHELQPGLDFLDGLFRVVIAAPEMLERAPEREAPDVLADQLWLSARVFAQGEPSRAREGVKIAAGRGDPIEVDAAVVAGARLAGRIAHVGALTADVVLLGDVGFSVPALARISGEARPLVLGRLVSLGRDARTGDALLRWKPIEELPEDPQAPREVPVQLFTGAGERGVPRGLVIGDTLLPRGAGPHVLRVQQHVDTRRLTRLWVRQTGDAARATLPEERP